MADLHLDKTSASSLIQGFGKSQEVTGSVSVGAHSVGAGATTTFTGSSAIQQPDAATITKVKVSGMGGSTYNNQWILLTGVLVMDSTAPSYSCFVQTLRTAGTLTYTVQFWNNTGVTQNVPAITVDFKTLLFNAPW